MEKSKDLVNSLVETGITVGGSKGTLRGLSSRLSDVLCKELDFRI